MTNRNLFLLLGTSLSLAPQTLSAQCVATQDCATLGYTETSCNGGKGVKCPFGNFWACLPTKEAICKEEGFTLACNETGQIGGGDSCSGLYKQCACDSSYQYTCSGTGYSGGSGAACSGKYAACTCTDGYEWKDGTCAVIDTCTIGALYYSDNTCSNTLESGKTLLGVVIYERNQNEPGWIITTKPIKIATDWTTKYVDIPGLNNYTTARGFTDTQDSCSNTDIITAYGNSSQYPAAWTAKNYKPAGTPSGKTWCLPSAGLLNTINSTNLSQINTGIATAGGNKLGTGTSYVFESIWSSSEYSNGYSWHLTVNSSNWSFGLSNNYTLVYDKSNMSVRPVLAF